MPGDASSRSMPPLCPPWVERMSAHCWYAISGDHPGLGLVATPHGTRYLVDNDPARDPRLNPARTIRERLRRMRGRAPKAPWSGRTGFGAITEAWNGAAYASRCGASGSMIVFGGGHDDYFGSDVHAFDLATREWRRIADGYVTGSERAYGAGAAYPNAVYPDGSPLPPHTYGYVQYDDAGNDYLLFKGQSELGPHVRAAAIPHLFDLHTLRWRHGPRHPTAILDSGGCTTWDRSRRVLWGHAGDDGGGNAFIGFAPDGDNTDGTFGRWTDCFPSKLPGMANHNAMQIDGTQDIIVVAVHADNELHAIDPGDPGRPIVRLRVTGTRPRLRPHAAMEYAANLGCLVYFFPHDDGIVHTITAADACSTSNRFERAWTWHACTPVADSLQPIADAARASRYAVNVSHVFGRFRVASFGSTDVAMLVRHVDTPVYACRLN